MDVGMSRYRPRAGQVAAVVGTVMVAGTAVVDLGGADDAGAQPIDSEERLVPPVVATLRP
jgi:hypothetical protein